MAKIRIEVKNDGTIEVKGEGFWGEECVEPIHELVEKLGQVLEERPLEDEEMIHISS